MTETRIDELLDEHVPPFEPRSDGWNDVLARAHTTRRRYGALAVVALALVLVPTAVALRGRIADLFQGTPAPPAVSTSFESGNRLADMATEKGFGARFPHADVSQAHGVVEIQTADGPQDLWVAPSDQGGKCWFADWANDPVGPDGQQYGFGGCDPSPPPSSQINWGSVWLEPHPDLVTVWGHVLVPATRVDVALGEGSTVTLPVVEGGFLGSLPKGAEIERITAYDDSGNAVAAATRSP
jgi:hypothetical protein